MTDCWPFASLPTRSRRIGLAAAVMAWCLLPAAIASAIPAAAGEAKGLPTEALYGTNLRPVDRQAFTASAAAPRAGHYVIETGGANLTLAIERAGGALRLRRTFAEPGAPRHTRSYVSLKRQADGSYAARRVTLRPLVDGGVLLLEGASGVDAIPDSLWIYYAPTK